MAAIARLRKDDFMNHTLGIKITIETKVSVELRAAKALDQLFKVR
jgi:hypothetical protein